MPRKTSVSEVQPEENSEGALRRSSRIAQNSPAPAKIPQRRNSASSNDTPAKIKTKRLSLSQESNGGSTDSKPLPDTSKTSTPRKNRSTRSTSKSPTALAIEQETKAAVVKTRARRGSLSKTGEGEAVDSPAPVSSRRRSLRSESASPTNQKDVEPATPKIRRGSTTEKITQLEAIEEIEESAAHPKKRYKGRRPSVTEMSQLDVIEETEVENKDLKKDLKSICEAGESSDKEKLSKTNELKSGDNETSTNDDKENKLSLTPVVRIEKSKTIADLSIYQETEDTKIKNGTSSVSKSKEVLNIEAVKKTENEVDNINPLDSSNIKEELSINSEGNLEEKEIKTSDAGPSLITTTADNEDKKTSTKGEVPEHVSKSDSSNPIAKLAAEDEIIVKDIDKLLGDDGGNKKSTISGNKETKIETLNDTTDSQTKNNKNPDENGVIEAALIPYAESPTDKIEPEVKTDKEIEFKAASPVNRANKSLSKLLPNQLDMSIGSDGSFNLNLSVDKIGGCDSQEEISAVNQDISTAETEVFDRSGSSDKGNIESIAPVSEATPKSKIPKESKLPLSNVSLNDFENTAVSEKESLHDDSCEPMDVDDPPLTYTEIASSAKRESLTNEVKSSPAQQVRKSIIPEKESEVISVIEQNEDTNENATDNATLKNHSEIENKPAVNEEADNLEDNQDKKSAKEDTVVKDLNTNTPSNQTIAENIKLDEEGCGSPVFNINRGSNDEKENNFPEKTQDASGENVLQGKINPTLESNENESTSRQFENNTNGTENAEKETAGEVITISDDEKDSFSLTDYTLSKSLTTPESLDDAYLARALKKGSNTSVNTPLSSKKDSSQIASDAQNNSGGDTSLSSPSEGVCSPKLVEVDVHENHKEEVNSSPFKEDTNKINKSSERSAEKESNLENYIEKEPVASTSTAADDISAVYSPEKADLSQSVISTRTTNNEIIKESENKSSSDDNNTVATIEVENCTVEKEIFAEKDSSAEHFEKQDTLPDYCLAMENSDLPRNPKIVDCPTNVETESYNNKSDDSNSLETTTQPLTVNEGLTDKGDEGCTSKKTNGNSSVRHVESKIYVSDNKETNEKDTAAKNQIKSPKLQIHSVVELKIEDSPTMSKKSKTPVEMNEKNESPKKKHLKRSSPKKDVLDELRILTNEFIDDMADEGEEDTPSDGSNDIPCEGESINSSDTYTEDDDDYENDSFIDDGEEKHELLSGEEDFLQKKTTEKEKVVKLTPKKDLPSKKRKRIITPSESEDDYQQDIEEKDIIQNPNSTEDVTSSEEDLKMETKGAKSAESEKESLVSQEASVIQIDEVNENLSNIPPDLAPSESDIVFIDNDNDSEVSESKEDTVKKNVNNSATEKKSKRKSSITIQENIKLEDIEDGELSARISKVVDWFCTGIKGGKCDTGNISLNVSLDYADQSSVDDNLEKDHDAEGNAKVDSLYKNNESVEKESTKKVVIEEPIDDVFVDTISKSEQSPKIHKKTKRKSLQKSPDTEDNEEIPTLIELSDFDKKDKYSPKLKEKADDFDPENVKPKGKRLSIEPVKHLSPKKHRFEAGFEVENIIIGKAGKKSKEIKSNQGKDAMKENIEHPETTDYHGGKLKKRTKRQREQEENIFETDSKKIKKKVTLKSVQPESNEDNIMALSRRAKGKKEVTVPLTDSGAMLRYTPNTYNTRKKKITFNKEFDVETIDKNLSKRERYLCGTKKTENIPCPSGSLKQYVFSNASVSKTEVDRKTERSKKLKRNVSQKLLPTRNIGLDDSWESEVFDVSLHPSISNKKMDDVSTSKKKKTESLFSPKDFKNRMLYDSSRVKRMDTKTLLKHRKNV